jgi:hypothetical protein
MLVKERRNRLILPLDQGSGSDMVGMGTYLPEVCRRGYYIKVAPLGFPGSTGFGHSCVPSCIGHVLTI